MVSEGATFRHGVHPQDNKARTKDLPVQRMNFVERYTLPLSQHLGAPSKPSVQPGDIVQRGQVIATPGGFVSTTLHSPVDGKVVAIEPHRHPNGAVVPCIVIAADTTSSQRLKANPRPDPMSLSAKDFVGELQKAGLVGMGGAAFPTHVKYSVPEGRKVERLVLNGCECEPYLTCDHRTMVERPDAVVRGIEIARHHLKAKTATIGVEDNKPDAARILRDQLRGKEGLSVSTMNVKYPQGAEKMLIKGIFGNEVPAGKLPLDLDMVVNNVGTMVAITDWFEKGQPLIERVVTVSGPGVRRPANLIVPIGTPVRAVFEACGGLTSQTNSVVMGGPMMGMPLSNLDVPVLKGTSGLLAFTDDESWLPQEYACVRCGRCLEACPYFLNPSRLGRLSKAERWTAAADLNLLDCMECGSCTFACPSGIPLVHLIKVAKSELRKLKTRGG